VAVPARTADTFEYALNTYSDMLLRIAYRNVKVLADAEDITQEVFIKLIQRDKGFESPEHEKAWLIRVTVNQCRDFLKSERRKKETALGTGIDIPAAEEKTSGTEVTEAVMCLPEKYRNVLYLYYYEGRTVPEIARYLQSRDNTVSSWLHRAREQLKHSLREAVVKL